jgi:hypothetical protein
MSIITAYAPAYYEQNSITSFQQQSMYFYQTLTLLTGSTNS